MTASVGRSPVELAQARARVLLHGRDAGRLRDTEAEIRERTGNNALQTYIADFSDLEEVRGLAETVARDHGRLDALVNNAGVGTSLPGDGARMESRDGYELRFAVNYLAHFLLTRSLLASLVSSARARIVNVSSAGQAPIDFDDVMLERDYTGVQAYCQSKLAQIMFTFDLAEELDAESVTANSLHPATFMPTKIVHAAGVHLPARSKRASPPRCGSSPTPGSTGLRAGTSTAAGKPGPIPRRTTRAPACGCTS